MAQVLETMVRNDILDLIGRAIFLLKPNSDQSSEEFQSNARFLDKTQSMFVELSKVAPQQLLEHHFRDYVRDWHKYRNHFLVLTDCSGEPFLHSDVIHFHFCREVWYAIAQLLGLASAAERTPEFCFRCAYARCANPEFLGGAQLACSKCGDAAYCSPQCQALDWMIGGSRGSHRELCWGKLSAREVQRLAQLAQ